LVGRSERARLYVDSSCVAIAMFHVEHRCGENAGTCGNRSVSFRRAVGAAGSLDSSTIPQRPVLAQAELPQRLPCCRLRALARPRVQVGELETWSLRGAPALPPAIAIPLRRPGSAEIQLGYPPPTSSVGFASSPPPPARAPSDSAGVPAPDHSRPPSLHSPPRLPPTR
jgi:hypothetical protein